MDIRKYQLFVDIAETKSLSKSGERLHYSQSGVSHTLKSLEKELGFQLFTRKKQGMYLTEAGKVMLPVVSEMLHCNERILQIVGELNHVQCGTVVIGSYASIASAWLPSILSSFSRDYPGISVQIKEGNEEELESMLTEGSIEFAFLSYRNQQKFKWLPMVDDEMMAVVPLQDDLAQLDEFPLEYFSRRPFILPEGAGTEYNIRNLIHADIDLQIHLSVMDDHTIISMVKNGLGCSVLPRLVLSDMGSSIRMLPMRPASYRTLGIAMMPDYNLTPAGKKLMQCAYQMYCDPKYQSASLL